ncbi:ABC transporter permease [Paraburkholderia caledonica]|uniref:ABC-type spermidine/putrescine transport system permease subunit II n=1 Tax=Paraburkholderia caledonica TaxID=134536 RepID=A0AB73INH1_9BURK|nr:ABC-type spermidine/putrescine transport system permease subunit II [Paraburkholderia caledonica]
MTRRTRLSLFGVWLTIAPALLLFAILFYLPLLAELAGSLGNGGAHASFLQWTAQLHDTQTRSGIVLSLQYAVASTALALAWGGAWAVGMLHDFTGKRLFAALSRIPIFMPGIIVALMMLTLLEQGGFLARTGLPLPRMVRDPTGLGVVCAMAWKEAPFLGLVIGVALAGVPEITVHAARSLGASPLKAFWLVRVPLAMPGIATVALLGFIQGMGAFAIPALLGAPYPKPLSVLIYEAFEYGDWARASALSALLSSLSVGVALLCYRLQDTIMRTSVAQGSHVVHAGPAMTRATVGRTATAASSYRARRYWLAALLYGHLSLTLGLPLVVLGLWSVSDGWFAPALLPQAYTASHWHDVTTDPSLRDALLTSLSIAAAVMTLCAAVAIPPAWALSRMSPVQRRPIELAVVMPLVVPGVVVATALGKILLLAHLSYTWAGVTLAQTVGTLPLMIWILTAGFTRISAETISAARSLGANMVSTVWYVALPEARRALLGGGLVVFASSLEEFDKTFIVGAPNVQTLPVLLYAQVDGAGIVYPVAAVASFVLMLPSVMIFLATVLTARD